MMPEMDGYEAMRQIREMKDFQAGSADRAPPRKP